MLSKRTYEEIKKMYPAYDRAKERLEVIPQDIARIRENKDESESDNELVQGVLQYKDILDELHNIYVDVNRLFS